MTVEEVPVAGVSGRLDEPVAQDSKRGSAEDLCHSMAETALTQAGMQASTGRHVAVEADTAPLSLQGLHCALAGAVVCLQGCRHLLAAAEIPVGNPAPSVAVEGLAGEMCIALMTECAVAARVVFVLALEAGVVAPEQLLERHCD